MADGGVRHETCDLRVICEALRRNKSSVVRRAAKEAWPYVEQSVVGGRRRLYALVDIPADVQDAIRRHRAIAAAEAVQPSADYQAGASLARKLTIAASVDTAVTQRECERGAATAAGLTGTRKARMDAKLELLRCLGIFAHARNFKLCAAMADFCAAYNSGALTVPVAVRYHTGAKLHPATLRRWKKQLKTQGAAALAGAYGNRAGTGKLDTNPALREFAIGLIADKPHISAKLVYEALDARFGATDADLPGLRAVQSWLGKWKAANAGLLMAVTNPDAWKNKYMAAFGSQSEGIERACQLWMLDSTPADLLLADGRYSLVGVIDVATRMLRLNVARTSNAEAVCQITRRAIIEWGVPEAVKIDNGQDYASDRFGTLLTGLEIEARFSTPFAGWEKAFIERVFRSFSHSLLELLPGFIGHNVAEAQAIRSRQSFADRLYKKNEVIEVKLTSGELQDFCDRWCRDYYAHEAHSGLNGDTPFQRYASLRNVVRRIGDVRALDLLLGENVTRKVGKKGLRIGSLLYIAPELAADGVMGCAVQVRVDDADIGRAVVYHDDRFLCVAECAEVTGVSQREIAIETRIQQTANIQRAKKELKAASKKANTKDVAWEILDRRAEKNAALSALPAPNVLHMTPALSAASDAADALEADAAPAGEYSAADLVALSALIRDEVAQDDTSRGRFCRALTALIKPEAERTDIDRQFLKGAQLSSEFRGNWMLFEEFGAGTFGLGSEFHALLPADAPFFTNNQGAI